MKDWPLQEAKARLSELVDTTLKKGPQQISRRGKRAVVVVPADEWDRLTGAKRKSVKDWLLGEPRFEIEVPSRKRFRRRSTPEL
jgi:prevent-host-death family protein